MTPLKCIIIDDDPLITDLIQHYCSKIPNIEYCLSFNNAVDGLRMISNQTFDVLFLDYNMPNLNGKALLDLKQDQSKVIMITSHPDFAVDSYKYPAVVNYLLKPISFELFNEALVRLQNTSTKMLEKKTDKETFFVKDGGKWIQVQIKDLCYIKSESNYAMLYLKEKQIMSLIKLKDMEKDLPDHFIRIHRSYIVNVKCIDYITADELCLRGKLLPVGAKYKQHLKKLVAK